MQLVASFSLTMIEPQVAPDTQLPQVAAPAMYAASGSNKLCCRRWLTLLCYQPQVTCNDFQLQVAILGRRWLQLPPRNTRFSWPQVATC
jgi:hypothetical protein